MAQWWYSTYLFSFDDWKVAERVEGIDFVVFLPERGRGFHHSVGYEPITCSDLQRPACAKNGEKAFYFIVNPGI